ncbi:hypothetical protein GCM10022236_31900 [Microlunatus ginsengisoli]|uniref:Uncharacterized protein n=1 Tax=Microlunatus ginsengisoli TaxID=363863 RepID=A0ABP7A945_9ACTN
MPVPTDLPTGHERQEADQRRHLHAGQGHPPGGRTARTQQVLVIVNGDHITVADFDGVILAEHTRPAPSITYVGNGQPRGPRPKTPKASRKS